ncbi:MAG: 30S ribosomal protein S18 [Patescibacteria group bacterium]
MPKVVRRVRQMRPVAQNCGFCANKTNLDYKDIETLRRYLTERGKIIGRSRTGICSRHQRQLGRAIKRARHVALLPFVTRA